MMRFGKYVLLILVGAVLVLYLGCGHWWRRARADRVREALLQEAQQQEVLNRYRKELAALYGRQPAIDIWIAVPDTPIDRSGFDRILASTAKSDWYVREKRGLYDYLIERVWPWAVSEPTTAETLDVANAINAGRGSVSDDHYHFSLVLRTELGSSSFTGGLAEYLGEASVEIRKGRLREISVKLNDVGAIASRHRRFAALLSGPLRQKLDQTYPSSRFELLDATACSFRNAAHIKHLFEHSSEPVSARLLHAALLNPWRAVPQYPRHDYFTLASAGRLRIPEAMTFGKGDAVRVCVAATSMNAFGEPAGSSQAIVAVEETPQVAPTVREVLPIDSNEFDARLVNRFMSGDRSSSREFLGTAFVMVAVIAFGLAILLVLLIVRQIELIIDGFRGNSAASPAPQASPEPQPKAETD